MAYAKALREKLGRLSVDMHAITNAAEKDNNRGLTPEELTKWKAMAAEYDGTEQSIEAAERTTSIVDSLANSGGKVDEMQIEQLRAEFQLSPAEKRRRDNEKNPHALAFSNYLRVGENRLSPQDREALVRHNNALGLPPETASVFLFGFFRRDYGAAGLFDMNRQGLLSASQLAVAGVTLTLFLPCIAQFLMMVRERGVRTALGMLAFITPFAFGAGFVVHLLLRGIR